MKKQDIDFVILWVDGNDPKWQEEKNKYSPDAKRTDSRKNRYRDWDILQYWFRGVEKFAPWVRKVHFVTWGHVPEWLNIDHPKLNIVNHKDFIPNECLPTFNANPIELNIHRIKGLSEGFVYFNDDMFLLSPVKPEDFVVDGKPKERLLFDAIPPGKDLITSILFNNMTVINKYFSKDTLKRKYKKLLFWPGYKKDIIFNILLYPWKRNTGFHDDHLPLYLTKSVYNEIWEKEQDLLYTTTSHKYRNREDVSAWLMKYWFMAQGNVVPGEVNRGTCVSATEDPIEKVAEIIKKQKYKMICCNDTSECEEFEERKRAISEAFHEILPEKSEFER